MRETNDTSYGGYQRWVPVELPNALRSCRATTRGDHNSERSPGDVHWNFEDDDNALGRAARIGGFWTNDPGDLQ